MRRVERVGAAVKRQHRLALGRAADHQIARDLLQIEDVERPALVESQVIGDVDQRIDRRRRPMARSRCCIQAGEGRSSRTHEPERETGAEMGVALGEGQRHADRGLALFGKDGALGVFSVPRPEAARSRAMPWIEVQSGRLGVRLISITGSSSPAQPA